MIVSRTTILQYRRFPAHPADDVKLLEGSEDLHTLKDSFEELSLLGLEGVYIQGVEVHGHFLDLSRSRVPGGEPQCFQESRRNVWGCPDEVFLPVHGERNLVTAQPVLPRHVVNEGYCVSEGLRHFHGDITVDRRFRVRDIVVHIWQGLWVADPNPPSDVKARSCEVVSPYYIPNIRWRLRQVLGF